MSTTAFDLLTKDIQRMIVGIGKNNEGNIYPLIVEEVERHVIRIVIEENSGNLFAAAKMLGISRSTLYRKIKVLKI